MHPADMDYQEAARLSIEGQRCLRCMEPLPADRRTPGHEWDQFDDHVAHTACEAATANGRR